LEIFKIFSVSAAARLYLFLISGGGSEILKIFPVSAAAAIFFWKKSAVAQPIGLHLYSQTIQLRLYLYITVFCDNKLVRKKVRISKVYMELLGDN
jgi:hypothetical protein